MNLFFCVFIFAFCDVCLLLPCWERSDLLSLLCVTFSCAFVTFPFGVLCQVWHLIVSIPDLPSLLLGPVYLYIYKAFVCYQQACPMNTSFVRSKTDFYLIHKLIS